MGEETKQHERWRGAVLYALQAACLLRLDWLSVARVSAFLAALTIRVTARHEH